MDARERAYRDVLVAFLESALREHSAGTHTHIQRGFMAQRSPAYRRILLKLSGEALLGSQLYGIDPVVIRRVAAEITEIRAALQGNDPGQGRWSLGRMWIQHAPAITRNM